MSRFDEVAKAATDCMQRLQRAIGDFRPTLLTPTQAGGRLSATRPDQRDRFRHLASLWVVGSIALAVPTWVCFQLGTNLTTAAFAFLIVIVLLSLTDSFVSSVSFSVVAVGCLNFFFVEPLFTFQIEYAQDLTALAAFLIASLAVTGLVRRVRRLGEMQEEQVSLLDLITDAVFVRDVNDKITYWNRGAEELYGWKRDEALGRVAHQLLQTVFPAPLVEITEAMSRSGHWEGELLHTTRAGEKVSVASRWSQQHNERGLLIGTLESNTDITERRRAEDELQRSQVAIDAIPAFASRYSAEGRREFVNERGRRYHGVSVAEVAADRPWISVHSDDIAPAERAWRHSIATGDPFEMEMRFRRSDGAYRWQLNRRIAHRDQSGRILKWYGVAFDIEDQKLAEDALRHSEARLAEAERELRLTLDSIPAITWMGAPNGYVQHLNKRWFEYTGATPEQVRGSRWKSCVHPDDLAQLVDIGRKNVASGKPIDGEARLRRVDGEYRWFLFRPAPARDEAGRIVAWYGTITDIEDRKRAETALRRNEAYLAEAQKLSRTGSFGWNVSTREIFWSEETLRIFGYEPTTKPSIQIVLQRVHPDDVALVRQVIDRASSDGEGFDLEHRLQMPDGSVKHLHVVARALGDEPQNLQFAGAIMDITAHKEAEQALRQSESRYQSLFQAMAASFWEVDMSRFNTLLRDVGKKGVDLRRHFDENPDFIREVIEAARIVDVNDQTVALFGRGNKQELLEASASAFWPEESWPVYKEGVLSAVAGEEVFSAETRMRKLDGGLVDVVFTTSNPREYRRKGQVLVGVIDITARKQAFLALGKSEQRYRHLFHHMPVALWQLNARGLVELFKQLRSEGVTDLGAYFDAHPGLVQRCMEMLIIEEVNEHTVQMLGGRNTSEFVGTSIARYFPENSATFRRSMVSRYRGDPNYAAETKLFTLDGRVVDVLYTASRVGPISEPGMSLLGVIDITERKQAEEALRRSERRYQNMFHAMAVAFFEFDFSGARDLLRGLRASGISDFRQHFKENPETVRQFMRATRIIEVNDHTVALVGRGSRDGLMGNVEPFWPEESTQAYVEVILSALERKRSFSVETPFRRVDRSVFDGHFTVWYSADEPTRGLAGVIDISERVKAQTMLSRVRADFAHAARVSMLGELTASIAHEVNQPLAAIAASGEAGLRWLARPTPEIDEVRELTKSVVADARRASEIIGRIRAMAAGRAPEQTLLSLDDVIREALLFLRHEVESRGVAVSHFPALGPQKVLADRTQLQQVIVNLAVNAMQAMAQSESARRNLSIRTVSHDPTTLCCSVEDSGPGIESRHITRLFDSFFTTKDGGMGMGLRICRSVIEAHGGRIAADNESSLDGARLYFTLPVAITNT